MRDIKIKELVDINENSTVKDLRWLQEDLYRLFDTHTSIAKALENKSGKYHILDRRVR